MSEERSQTLIASVQRALTLVDVVASAPRPVPVKTVARLTGLTLGTAYNIARTLVHEGYLAQEPDGLVLGGRFPGLRPSDDEGVFLAKTRNTLRSVTEQLGVTAYLSRYDDGEVQVVDIVDAAASPRVELWVGINRSAHATALGKQILAELAPEERMDYLSSHPLEELTPHTVRDRRALLSQLERTQGATLEHQEYALGYTCVAVPVRAPGVLASLAVSLPHRQLGSRLDDTIAHLKSAAGALSIQLGTEHYGRGASALAAPSFTI
ncbi:IclR family transcriptional regulator [Microbacterium sp. STN6]|uniref:IclR family transcriptional regulator n=1 Tax=Microbacterium sp. STN6 TaxID=2995588 RepID=UPI002260A013|nr:IclR family transcriptional regulator [Microbacterium sp. STN6]MCX7521757.1 IclR family transcriptional regulator [Microbacterium sp. STN6]